jgi:hypothetical protein
MEIDWVSQHVARATVSAGPLVRAAPEDIASQPMTLVTALIQAISPPKPFPEGNVFVVRDVLQGIAEKVTEYPRIAELLADKDAVLQIQRLIEALKTAKVPKEAMASAPQPAKTVLATNAKALLVLFKALAPHWKGDQANVMLGMAVKTVEEFKTGKYVEEFSAALCEVFGKADPEAVAPYNQQIVDLIGSTTLAKTVAFDALGRSFRYNPDPVLKNFKNLVFVPSQVNQASLLVREILSSELDSASAVVEYICRLLIDPLAHEDLFNLLDHFIAKDVKKINLVGKLLAEIESNHSKFKTLTSLNRVGAFLEKFSQDSLDNASRALNLLTLLSASLHGDHLLSIVNSCIQICLRENTGEKVYSNYSSKFDQWKKERDERVAEKSDQLIHICLGKHEEFLQKQDLKLKEQEQKRKAELQTKIDDIVNSPIAKSDNSKELEKTQVQDPVLPVPNLKDTQETLPFKTNFENTLPENNSAAAKESLPAISTDSSVASKSPSKSDQVPIPVPIISPKTPVYDAKSNFSVSEFSVSYDSKANLLPKVDAPKSNASLSKTLSPVQESKKNMLDLDATFPESLRNSTTEVSRENSVNRTPQGETKEFESGAQKSGVLEMNRGAIQGWKTFDAIIKDGEFVLKKQKTKKKVEDAPEVIKVSEISSLSVEKKGCFNIVYAKEKYQLRAANDTLRDEWVAELKKAGAL